MAGLTADNWSTIWETAVFVSFAGIFGIMAIFALVIGADVNVDTGYNKVIIFIVNLIMTVFALGIFMLSNYGYLENGIYELLVFGGYWLVSTIFLFLIYTRKLGGNLGVTVISGSATAVGVTLGQAILPYVLVLFAIPGLLGYKYSTVSTFEDTLEESVDMPNVSSQETPMVFEPKSEEKARTDVEIEIGEQQEERRRYEKLQFGK